MALTISSPELRDGQAIPPRFTCDGDGVSPALEFHGVPEGTAELAVLVEDPDAPGGTFLHWAIWRLAPSLPGLAEGEVPADAEQATNDFGRIGYGGPCPPAGRRHRYVFTVLALSALPSLAAGAGADSVRKVLPGHVLDSASLTCTYAR